MTTLDSSWSAKLRKISELELPDHYHLTEEDDCYFFGEYTARGGYSFSGTNQVISNLKKKPSKRHTYEWAYKIQTIQRVGKLIAENINPNYIGRITFIPIPPSKPKGHQEHDDRMLQVARAITNVQDVREAIITTKERNALHESDSPRSPEALRAYLSVTTQHLDPTPEHIFLLDDVITTGCSFKACKALLREHLPETPVTGVFVSRRVLPSPFGAFS